MRKSTQCGEIAHQSCRGPAVNSIDHSTLNLEEGTHCHTAIHRAFLRGVDKEEGYSWDQYQGGNYTNVLDLELAQIFCLVLVEDNEEDVQSHGKGPEYIR